VSPATLDPLSPLESEAGGRRGRIEEARRSVRRLAHALGQGRTVAAVGLHVAVRAQPARRDRVEGLPAV